MKIFLDSNVFIWAYNRPGSNSAKILELMDEEKITVVVSERVIEELRAYFINYYNKDVWSAVFNHVSSLVKIVFREDVGNEVKKWKDKINKKDLEHLATVKMLKLEYLISYDDDFKPFEEYRTPRQFIRELGMRESDSEY